ncbi:MAG TPA: hypothetical protein VK815_07050, partial [Candidatus Acidoferrales bacterium]|nr:hypothetical protein [Candidatus Acidoferrales bacterium]
LVDVEPTIALFIGAALLTVFLTALLAARPAVEPGGPSLIWTIYRNLMRLTWALLLVTLLGGVISVLRSYLQHSVANFQQTHGRVTQANYNAVQTIWGAEQAQGELNVDIYHTEEVTERIESEDPAKPALLKTKKVHKSITGNPFVSARHQVTLRQNPRKKGSAYYDGYETDCAFAWKLRNPADTAQKIVLTFPLPAQGAMYDGLSATLDGRDVLPEMQIKDASLVLERDVTPDEVMDFRVAFKSRGLASWDFQVREAREIRDFTLTLTLPDLVKAKLNYPEGCMPPTDIKPTKDTLGSVLTYRLDHALTDKGMGIALPELAQPGETTRAVLDETENAWLLVFAALALSMAIAGVRHAVLLVILFAAGTAFGYGLLANFSDLLFGFWGTFVVILVPLFTMSTLLLLRVAPEAGHGLAMQFVLFGVVYPCLAGLDPARQPLYLNLCALGLLVFTAQLLVRRLGDEKTEGQTVMATPSTA